MKPSFNANSSDLEHARSLAARVGLVPARERAAPPAHGYVRFGAGAADATAAADAELTTRAGTARSNWEQALRHCLERTRGEGMIVLDESALVVAAAGVWRGWTQAQMESLGPRLMAALDQAERIEGAFGGCRMLALQAGLLWLTGVRLQVGEGRLTVGLLGPTPLSADLQLYVEGAVRRALPV
jgi:hypothetical protein